MASLREENLARGKILGQRDLFIFGKNPSLQTGVLGDFIPWGGLYQFQETASEFYASSTDPTDVGIACVALLLDENWDAVTILFQLNGTTPVQLIAPNGGSLFIRGNTCFNVDPLERATQGDVYIGTDPAPVGGIQPVPNRVIFFSSNDQQSNMGVYSVQRNASVLIHAIINTINRDSGTSSATDIYLRTRNRGEGPFRRRTEAGVQTGGTSVIDYNIPIPVDVSGNSRQGTDIVLSAVASANNTRVGGGFLIQVMDE